MTVYIPEKKPFGITHLFAGTNKADPFIILSKSHTISTFIIMPPPFEEEGYIVLHMSVRPSTRWFPDDNSRTLRPRIMKLHRYIDHDWQMTPIDFQVTRSKVKVTVTRHSKMVSG